MAILARPLPGVRVLPDGIDVKGLRLEFLRRQISIVLQEPLLFPGARRRRAPVSSNPASSDSGPTGREQPAPVDASVAEGKE